MSRLASLVSLTHRVEEAVATRDWEALALADKALISALSGQGAWGVAEQAALDDLRRAHEEASKRCVLELEQLGERLRKLSTHKDGCLAYANGANFDESQT